MVSHVAVGLISVLGLGCSVASAQTIYVDRRGGVDGHDGSAPDQAVRSISDGVALAESGDTVVIADGTYRETVRVTTEGVVLQAAGDAVLQPERNGLIIEAAGVVVEGLTIDGGDTAGTAVDVRAGGAATLRDVWVEAFDGTALRVTGGSLDMVRGGVEQPLAAALLVSDGGRAIVSDGLLRGDRFEGSPAALVQVHGEGSELSLDHSLVTGAPRSCVRSLSGASLTVSDSIITGCGVENDVTMDVYAVVQDAESVASVDRSLVSGQANAPHERLFSGGVTVGATTVLNPTLDFAGLDAAHGFLSITVDDSPNLAHAMALSSVLDRVGGHLSFFANFPSNLSYAAQGDLIDLVERGHEVGGHAVTNGRLTETAPIELAWSGGGAVWVDVSEDGRALSAGQDDATWLTVDLTAAASDTLLELCDAIEASSSLQCSVRSDDPSALPIYADPTGLASGTTVVSSGWTETLLWDRRLPSEGGRHFRNELVEPRLLLSEMVGQQVTSVAYPGQKHDAVVRAAAADAGFRIGRGATGYASADHRYSTPFDWMQSPISLTATAVRGPGYDALSVEAQEERVRGFARTWSTHSRESGVMGALTIHAPETFDVHELEWLVDELSDTSVHLWSVGEVAEWLEVHGSPAEEGLWVGPAHHFSDYRPGPSSDAVDRGEARMDRTTDALGQPIYGAPDAGPFEHQPAARLAADALPLAREVEVFDDGRFMMPGEPVARLSLEPLAGRPVLEAATPRGVWARLTVAEWTGEHRRWTMQDHDALESVCASVADLSPGTTWMVSVNGLEAGTFEVGLDGLTSFVVPPGVTDVSLRPVAAGGGQLVEACTPTEAPIDVGRVIAAPIPGSADAFEDQSTARRRTGASSGCSTTSSASSRGVAWLVVALAGLLVRRRRDGGNGA